MSKAAALPLFGDAYMADTMHLTLEEHGAYLRLLMLAWRTPDCSLPNDDNRLARMLGISSQRWKKLRPAVMDFWTLENGVWTQKRLKKERIYVAEKSKKNSENAKARWEQVPENIENDECDRTSERICQTDAPPPPPIDKEPKGSSSDNAKKSSRGTRLAEGWKPSKLPKEILLLAEAWPAGVYKRTLDEFRDYWTALPGNRALKLDWDKTWHNRIRDRHEFVMRGQRHGNGSNGTPTPKSGTTGEAARRLRERFAAQERSQDELFGITDGEGQRLALPAS